MRITQRRQRQAIRGDVERLCCNPDPWAFRRQGRKSQKGRIRRKWGAQCRAVPIWLSFEAPSRTSIVLPQMITGLALLNAAGRFDNAATASAAEAAAAAEADADAAAAVEPEDTSIGAKLNEWWRRAVAQFIFLSTKVRIGQILEQARDPAGT